MNTMKRFRKVLIVFLMVLWSVPPIATAMAETPSIQPGTLESILHNKVLRVGVSLFTPWTIKQPDGQLVGFEIDVANRLAKDLGVQAEFHVLDWEHIVPALLNRDIDIIVAGIVITPGRALKMNFSQPYDSSGIGLITNIALTKTFKGPEDLNRREVTITAVTGTISEEIARRVFSKATIKTFPTSEGAIQAITSGKVHGYVEHEPITTFTVLDNPDLVDKPLSQPLLETKAGFAVNKGDPDFINFLNAWIIAHKADTWLRSVHKYWFEGIEWRKAVVITP